VTEYRDTSPSSPAHLHCRSHYSHLWGTAAPAALCDAAQRRGTDVLALTDSGGLYGVVPFLREAERTGLLPIIGAELVLREERLVILVESSQGYAHLCSALSELHMTESPDTEELLARSMDGLLVLCPPGRLLDLLRRVLPPGDVLFMEITPRTPLRLAKATSDRIGVPPVASWPVSYPEPAERDTHLLARAVGLRTSVDRLTPADTADELEYMPAAGEFRRRFAVWPETLTNNRVVAERCAHRWDIRKLVDAARPEKDDDREELKQRCLRGARRRFAGLPRAVEERLERELRVIAHRGFSAYFLVVQRLVREAPLRCGRGSAAGSLVSYCLGLTDVDPLQHDLLFERFLSEDRPDPPDIDIDLPWDERHTVLRKAIDELGPARAAMVATHVHMKLAGALYELGKAVGLPPKQVADVTRRLRYRFEEMDPRSHPLFRDLRLREPWPQLLGQAVKLKGMPKHLSVHCGGVVTGEPSLWSKVPVQRSRTGFAVVQWDKDQVEEAGLVKIDILGNRSLAVVRDTLERLRAEEVDVPSYESLRPLDDPATQSLMATGGTMGVFYVESPPMRQLLAKAGRGDLPHLVIHSSIIRPAAYSHIAEYLRRLKGEPREALHPLAERILSANYGLMYYQEDVTRVAMQVGGLSAAEAEMLRRSLSKKPGAVPLSQFRDAFLEGAAEHGLSERQRLELWDMMESFAGYSFCKAHSASYAMVSFKAGYLKAHWPAHFMAAVLSNGGGYYSPLAYIWEARRQGVRLLPPHINASHWGYRSRADTIRVGFMQVNGIGRSVADRIVEVRNAGGPFHSLEEFWARVRPAAGQLDVLVKAGCFDELHECRNRSQLLWVSRVLSARRQPRQTDLWTDEVAAPPLPPPSERERWLQEVEAFGFPLTGTPLDPHESVLKTRERLRARELSAAPLGETTLTGWLLTRKPARTKRDEPMEFLSFDDGTGLFEVTVFPDVWRVCACRLRTGRCYLVRGKIEDEYGVRSVTAAEVTPLSALARAA
jgi:DNA-directed DNA polymerase III PolC